jgi:Tfp pilus assembly protein FimV
LLKVAGTLRRATRSRETIDVWFGRNTGEEDMEMARKTRLTAAAVKIGTAAGRADRTARKVARAAQVAREELAELSKRVEELARDLKKARSRLKQALR